MSYSLRRYFKSIFVQKMFEFNAKKLCTQLTSNEVQISSSNFVASSKKSERSSAFPKSQALHIPVMAKEVVDILAPHNGQTVIDMTFGGGGHSKRILDCAAGIQLIAVDRDPLAHSLCMSFATEQKKHSTVIPLLGRFSELLYYLPALGIQEGAVDSFLFDLGASSMQFDNPQRGFSLSQDGPLDMRMDGEKYPDQPTAADVVNNLDTNDLHLVFRRYGEERLSRSIAHAIVEARFAFGNITRTQQLASLVNTVFEGNHRHDKLQRHSHPATKIFQALRILVNNELNELNNGLELAWNYLRPGGCCVVISFHSLEDRVVKRHFHGIEMDARANMTLGDHYRNSIIMQSKERIDEILAQRWKPLSKKVLTPELEELNLNPRARSAKLRAAFKM